MHRIDLLVVVGVFLMAAGIATPAVYQANAEKARQENSNNLKQLGIACHNIHDVYARMPLTVGSTFNGKTGTLHYHLLPYIEEGPAYKAADLTANIPTMRNAADRSIPDGGVYKKTWATTNYAANWLVFQGGPRAGKHARIPVSFPDGTSNTLLFAERYQRCNGTPCLWGYNELYYWAPVFAYYSQAKFQVNPAQQDCNPALAQSIFRDGIYVGMADGSVKRLSNDIGPLTWALVCHPADGQALPADYDR
jgi:hypothetical protein